MLTIKGLKTLWYDLWSYNDVIHTCGINKRGKLMQFFMRLSESYDVGCDQLILMKANANIYSKDTS